jgi:mRNA-degrading endonuclease YafQ of YafQ-DinJ toxin-antitoxin module
MRVALAEGFQRDVRGLSDAHRQTVFEVMLGLPRAIGDPHLHAGLGIRKLHASGIWEARVGLGLRMVFTLETNQLTLVRVGSHDEVRRFLRQL